MGLARPLPLGEERIASFCRYGGRGALPRRRRRGIAKRITGAPQCFGADQGEEQERGIVAEPETIHFRGRVERVQRNWLLGGINYYVLEELGMAGRKRFRAFDATGGPQGAYRAILVLPHGPEAEQQADVWQRLSQNNSNVPTVLHYCVEQDEIVLVCVWVEGEDLARLQERIRMGRAARVSAAEACQLIRGLAHGMGHFHHQRNVVHGDIKPANLVVAREPNRLVMIDFGSSWLVERTTGRQAGDGVTRGYASPEQLTEQLGIGFQSDQFSVCVVWYELLTGMLPYDGLGGQAGIPEYRLTMAKKYVVPSQLSPDRQRLPGDVWSRIDACVTRGLSLDASDRYPDKSSWLNALDEIQYALKHRSQLGPSHNVALKWLDWLSRPWRR